MACENEFAVVFFESDNIYSEIPVSWLTPDRKQCWWPNVLNPRSRMIRGEKPNDDDTTVWTLHDIKLESYASTLETARKKAEEPDYVTGNEQLVLGPRQRKPKNYETSSSSSTDNFTPPPSPKTLIKPKGKQKASKKSLNKIKDKINKQNSSPETAGAILSQTMNSSISRENIKVQNPIEDNGPQPIVIQDDSSQNFAIKDDNIPLLISKENPTIADLHLQMQQLVISVDAIHKYMISIDKRLKALTMEKGNWEMNEDLETLMSRLPCKTYEDVEKLDQDIVNSQELKKTFIQYIKRIGGKDLKDNVNRCLPCLFTNELGTHCSYVGFRGNFKLQDFVIMKLFVDCDVATPGYITRSREEHWRVVSAQQPEAKKKK